MSIPPNSVYVTSEESSNNRLKWIGIIIVLLLLVGGGLLLYYYRDKIWNSSDSQQKATTPAPTDSSMGGGLLGQTNLQSTTTPLRGDEQSSIEPTTTPRSGDEQSSIEPTTTPPSTTTDAPSTTTDAPSTTTESCIYLKGKVKSGSGDENLDHEDYTTDSMRDCCNACNEMDKCKTFVYKIDDKTCWLKDDIYPRSTNSGSGYVYGYSQSLSCDFFEGEAKSGSGDEDLTDEPGITPPVILSAEDCCNACNERDGCKTFVYKTDDKTCWLKDDIYGRSSNSRSGYVYGYNQSISCDFFEGEAKSGSGKDLDDEPSSLDSAEDCCNACTERDGCKTFTYKTDDELCWLKDDINPRSTNSRSGYVSGYSQSLSCDFFEGEAKSGSGDEDIEDGLFFDISAEECCNACNETNGCKTFTYKAAGTGTCWLKDDIYPRNSNSRSGYVSGYSVPTGEEGFTLDGLE